MEVLTSTSLMDVFVTKKNENMESAIPHNSKVMTVAAVLRYILSSMIDNRGNGKSQII